MSTIGCLSCVSINQVQVILLYCKVGLQLTIFFRTFSNSPTKHTVLNTQYLYSWITKAKEASHTNRRRLIYNLRLSRFLKQNQPPSSPIRYGGQRIHGLSYSSLKSVKLAAFGLKIVTGSNNGVEFQCYFWLTYFLC